MSLVRVGCLAFLACGCEGSESNPTAKQLLPRRAPAESVAKVLQVDAAAFEPKLDPVAPAGDLRAEIDAFTTVEACVQQRSRMDPMLGDALEAMGYDTFFSDACRVVDAAKAGDPKRCAGITASALRNHCRGTVAELRATPNLCPWVVPSQPAVGRDPACVAIAARSAPLCAVERDPVERTVCVTLLDRSSHDALACRKLFSPAERERCTRTVARWRSALGPIDAQVDASAALAPAGTLRIDRSEDAGGDDTLDLKHELENGTVLVEDRGGVSLVIGWLEDSGATFLALSPNATARFGIEVAVAQGHGGVSDGRVRRLEVRLPGQAPLLARSPAGLTVRVDTLGRERGATVQLTIDGEVHGQSSRVHVEVSTFVRDVVTAADALTAAAHRGDDGLSNGESP